MKIETVDNGYVVTTEDIDKRVFTSKKALFDWLKDNISDVNQEA